MLFLALPDPVQEPGLPFALSEARKRGDPMTILKPLSHISRNRLLPPERPILER